MSDQTGRKRARLQTPSDKELYDITYENNDIFPPCEAEDEFFLKDSKDLFENDVYCDYNEKLKEMEKSLCENEGTERDLEEKNRRLILDEKRRELRKKELEAEFENLKLKTAERELEKAKYESKIAERELEKAKYESKIAERELEKAKYESEIAEQESELEYAKRKIQLEKEWLKVKEEERKLKWEEERRIRARSKFVEMFPKTFDTELLISIAYELGPFLIDLVERKIDDEKLTEILEIIRKFRPEYPDICNYIRRSQKIRNRPILIPLNDKNDPIVPSEITTSYQLKAAKDDMNFVYPFPGNDITNHFPVLFCHPVFSDFMNIIHNQEATNAVKEFNMFLNCNIKDKIDVSSSHLISAILNFSENDKEIDLVNNVTDALKKLFSSGSVIPNLSVIHTVSKKYTMDSAIVIHKFPFIIIEAKNHSYSIRAVLQGLQYYGLTNEQFIDNDPSFLITVDRGIFFVYGVAKVNRRVVCTCLLSLEFTDHFFNVADFGGKLYRCLGALLFFHDKFAKRIEKIKSDQQHILYSAIKSAPSYNDQPLPAIFSIKSESDSQERIDIKINEDDKETILKPGVYKVQVDDKFAILKLAHNYNADVHRALAANKLAPELLGHEILCDNCHVILMEYLDSSLYCNMFELLRNNDDSGNEINHKNLYQSLSGILDKLKELKIVHGDFRSNNILAKKSPIGDYTLKDFKLVDFEFSGQVGEPYPFLAMRNPAIRWPSDFFSYEPRKFDHDEHMLNEIIKCDFKKNIEDLK